MMIIFGAQGQIAEALAQAMRKSQPARKILTIPWPEGEHWKQALSRSQSVPSRTPDSTIDVVFANGITNPRMPADEIMKANVIEPLERIEQALRAPNAERFRFLTIGTIQENFPELCRPNPYLNSKFELGTAMAALARKHPGRFMHVRLHTVYAPVLRPHMFLGQIVTAIRERKTFGMSQGRQLREYHHVDDVARNLVSILAEKNAHHWKTNNVEMNSGKPVRLAELAEYIFKNLKCTELLKVGAIQAPEGENTELRFKRSDAWILPADREPMSGVLETVRVLTENAADSDR